MRSTAFVLFSLVSACAVGTNGLGDDVTPEDAGNAKDSSSKTDVTQPLQDSGTAQDVAQPDVSQPVDSGPTNPCAFSGTLATYDFTGELGSQTSTVAKTSASNVTAGAVSRASTLTATAGADSLNSSAWATATTVNKAKYVTFSITPKGSCTLNITKISIDTKSSGTGPTQVALATSDDAFAAMTALTPNAVSTPSLSITGATGAVEIRLYGWSAGGTGGTMRVETTLTVSGSTN